MTKVEAVRVLANLDTMCAPHIPDQRRAWAHMFIALGLLQKVLPNPELMTRERFMELAGSVYDTTYNALRSASRDA